MVILFRLIGTTNDYYLIIKHIKPYKKTNILILNKSIVLQNINILQKQFAMILLEAHDRWKLSMIQEQMSIYYIIVQMRSYRDYLLETLTFRIELEQILICPITFEPMKQPVTLPCGHTFDQTSILKALQKKNECPLDRKRYHATDLVHNISLKSVIQAFNTYSRLPEKQLINRAALLEQLEKKQIELEKKQAKIKLFYQQTQQQLKKKQASFKSLQQEKQKELKYRQSLIKSFYQTNARQKKCNQQYRMSLEEWSNNLVDWNNRNQWANQQFRHYLQCQYAHNNKRQSPFIRSPNRRRPSLHR